MLKWPKRFWVIVRTLYVYGLLALLLPHIRPRWLQKLCARLPQGRHADKAPAVRLRLALEALGPIFVKFGQVLSTRPDLIAPDYARELAQLQDNVPPFDGAVAVAQIEASLGKPVAALYARFNPQPVASASIAQVHEAHLFDDNGGVGEKVAVKVLRPQILPVIEQDLALMQFGAVWIERLLADGKRLKPREVVAEFDKYLHDELDLVREAANGTQLRRNMASLDLLLIPEMHWELCRSDVIVMQRMYGVPIGRVDALRAAGVDFKQLAKAGVDIFFTQVFRDGFFHADMHPGNIMVSLQPETFGRYIALDFGIVGTLSDFDKDYLAQNFIAFFRRDYKRVAELHVESGWVPADARIDELEAAVRSVCEPQFARPLKDISLGQVLLRLFQVSRRFKVEIQPQLVLLQKTLLNVEGLGRQLDPDLDLWTTAQPFLEKWMKSQVGWPAFRDKFKNESTRYAQYLPEIPRLLHQALLAQEKRDDPALRELLQEQRRTNALLQTLMAFVVGFIVAVLLLAAVDSHWLQLLF